MTIRKLLHFLGAKATPTLRSISSPVRWAVGKVCKPSERRNDDAEYPHEMPSEVPAGPVVARVGTAEVIVLDRADAEQEHYLRDLDLAVEQMRRDFALRTARIIEQMEKTHGS